MTEQRQSLSALPLTRSATYQHVYGSYVIVSDTDYDLTAILCQPVPTVTGNLQMEQRVAITLAWPVVRELMDLFHRRIQEYEQRHSVPALPYTYH